MNLTIKDWIPLSALGVLRAIKRQILVSTFRERVVSHRYLGFPMTIHICDPVGAEWYDQDSECLDELGALRESYDFASKENVFVLGAHQGLVALVISRLQAQGKNVIAVEGSQFNIGVATRNVNSNGKEGIRLVHALVSDQTGWGSFVDVGNGYIGRNKNEKTVSVECVTLDELVRRFGKPDLVMVDIEGAEGIVLSSSNLIEQKDCDFAVELHGDDVIANYGGSNESVVRKFLERGYKVSKFVSDNGIGHYVDLDSSDQITSLRTHILCKAA